MAALVGAWRPYAAPKAGRRGRGAMAVYIGTLGYDFTVNEPPKLVEHLRTLSERYARATGWA